ncbi:TPA: 23S rRNA methylase leader peptide ErmCL, partial [Staphylococcus aureus]|nr:23S rRNA methylase leader peptide ErmCL [Staphylococcus aureus]
IFVISTVHYQPNKK